MPKLQNKPYMPNKVLENISANLHRNPRLFNDCRDMEIAEFNFLWKHFFLFNITRVTTNVLTLYMDVITPKSISGFGIY